MDLTDKRILLELDKDCRASYENLGRILGISANAVKKRVDKLISSGVIEEFSVVLRQAMTGADYLIAEVQTDGNEDEETFANTLGANEMINQVGLIADPTGRSYLVHAEYVGTQGLMKLGRFLRALENVTQVDLHTLLIGQGKRMDLTKLHLRVLRQLMNDARMQIGEIAERSGLTARRVRKAIQELQESEAFWFATRWNLSLGESTQFYVRINRDTQVMDHNEVDEWMRGQFPLEYWYSYVSAIEPVIFAKFVTEHFRQAEPISRVIKAAPFAVSTNTMICYPVRKYPRLGRIKLEQMLADAGLWP
ncbi:MAG: winged helix-turn-helix transcriptional regulator [Candidatus Thorarchaeota archaeon]|nr:MAG: winged helix-turn-helix transcriptional regulator [Candidatus Thorarchaeota archaeon]